MRLDSIEISSIIKQQIEKLSITPEVRSEGTIINLKDGIATIHGLGDVLAGELIQFNSNIFGIALNLERDVVGAIVLGNYESLSEGTTVKCTGRVLEIPVGKSLLGRVVDALGNPIDGKGPIKTTATQPIENIAPGVIWREPINVPLQTGIKAIDAMIPIGRGQRELIIGDRQTGKTAIGVDAIINQKKSGVKCIYVAIGQKNSSVAFLVKKLEEYGALPYTVVVVAGASEAAAMQYIAPYAGCAIGEYFRNQGEDALIIYDDLTKHAWAYRQISLLLHRPPGREAYPGDIFYLHSRLLERSARVNAKYVEDKTHGQIKDRAGSLTALPIVETQAGDISAFIPTNIISITDGQIYLETSLFNAGIRPAINTGLSVSRVGGAAQTSIIKKLASGLRLSLAQFRELESFAQFAADLDETTRKQIEHGERALEMLKQAQYSPQTVAEMVVSLYIIEQKLLGDIPLNKVIAFEKALHNFMSDYHQDLLDEINANPIYTETNINRLKQVILDAKSQFATLF